MKKSHIIAIMALTAFVFLLNYLLNQNQNVPRPHLQIGTNVWPGYEPLYLARTQGTLNEKEVRLIEYPNASEVIRAFRNGVIQGAALTLDEVFLLIQDNIPLKVVLVMDFSNGGDAILARPPIRSMKALKGKRIGFESTALGGLILSRALIINHLTYADIQPVNIAHNEHFGAFVTGEVDAVVTFEPIRTKILQEGANIVFSSSEIPGEIVDVLIVSENTLQTNRDLVNQLLDAWFKSIDDIQKHKQETAAIMARRENVTPEEFITSLSGLTIPDRQKNREMLAVNDGKPPKLEKQAAFLRHFMLQQSLLRLDIELADFIDSEYFNKKP